MKAIDHVRRNQKSLAVVGAFTYRVCAQEPVEITRTGPAPITLDGVKGIGELYRLVLC